MSSTTRLCPLIVPALLLLLLLPSPINAMTTSFRRGLVPTQLGLVHYTTTTTTNERDDDASSQLLPIVGFHMSPRSVDEYKEIMEECQQQSKNRPLFIAMDEFGYGQSDSPSKSCTLDEIADCFLEVLDHLGVKKCIVAGSLMGCYFALSLASRHPDRVAGVVCSNLYYFQAAAREEALKEAEQTHDTDGRPIIEDSWELQDDGSHISEIWGKRSSWLSSELNTRATLDNFNYLVKRKERYGKGISIQDGAAFPFQETCEKVTCPVLCINGAGAVAFFDMIGMAMSKQFEEAMGFFPATPDQVVLEPPGASINMLNENAKGWMAHVLKFAEKIDGK